MSPSVVNGEIGLCGSIVRVTAWFHCKTPRNCVVNPYHNRYSRWFAECLGGNELIVNEDCPREAGIKGMDK